MKSARLSLIALSALLLCACGSQPKPATPTPVPVAEPLPPATASELITQQLEQVEVYCACTSDQCKSEATARIRNLISLLMDELVEETKKSDFDPTAPFGEQELMQKIADRVTECELPREELKVEMTPELKATAKATMSENAEMGRKAIEAQTAAHHLKIQTACDGGDGAACYQVAESIAREAKTEPGIEKVSVHIYRSCELGYGEGCRVIAQEHQNDDDPKSLKVALSYFERGCEKNDDVSCFALSDAYTVGLSKKRFSMQKGLGVKKDMKKARFFKEKAKRLMMKMAEENGVRGVMKLEEPPEPQND